MKTISEGFPVIDYPQDGETVNWPDYTVRVHAPSDAQSVEIAFDQGPWRPCRQSGGYWWYDWTGFDPGEHEVISRCAGADESVVKLSDPRHMMVWSYAARKSTPVRDLMSPSAQWVSPDATVREAAEKMRHLNVGFLPVLQGRKLIGVLTDRDIVVRVIADGGDPEDVPVDEIMTRSPETCREDDLVRDVAKAMQERRVRRVPVLDKRERLVGVLSLGDFPRRREAQELVAEVLDKVAAVRR